MVTHRTPYSWMVDLHKDMPVLEESGLKVEQRKIDRNDEEALAAWAVKVASRDARPT